MTLLSGAESVTRPAGQTPALEGQQLSKPLLARANGSGIAWRRPVRHVSNPGVFEHRDAGWDGAAPFEAGVLPGRSFHEGRSGSSATSPMPLTL